MCVQFSVMLRSNMKPVSTTGKSSQETALSLINHKSNVIICLFYKVTLFDEGRQFHKRSIILGQRDHVPDDDKLGLGPGHGHIEYPGVEEDVPRPSLLLVHCTDLHTDSSFA